MRTKLVSVTDVGENDRLFFVQLPLNGGGEDLDQAASRAKGYLADQLRDMFPNGRFSDFQYRPHRKVCDRGTDCVRLEGSCVIL